VKTQWLLSISRR